MLHLVFCTGMTDLGVNECESIQDTPDRCSKTLIHDQEYSFIQIKIFTLKDSAGIKYFTIINHQIAKLISQEPECIQLLLKDQVMLTF